MSHVRWAVALAGMLVWAGPVGTAPTKAAVPVQIKAWVNAPQGQVARLSVQAALADGWHTHSNTSEGQSTQINVDSSRGYRQVGAFRADSEPKIERDGDKLVEKHSGTVTWSAPIELAEDVDLRNFRVTGKVHLLLCEKKFSQPFAQTFVALLNPEDGTQAEGGRSGDPNPGAAGDTKSEKLKPESFKDVLDGLGKLPGGGASNDPISLKAWITEADAGKPRYLVIEASIERGWHIYSRTQPEGGPLATKIDVQIGGDVTLGKFEVSPKPKTHFDSTFGINVEEHEGKVQWKAPLTLGPSADKDGMKIAGTVSAQACDASGCRPPKKYEFVAVNTLKTSRGEYRAPRGHVAIRGHFEPKAVAPGGRGKLVLTALPDEPYHIYSLNSEPKSAEPTLIALTSVPSGWKAGQPTASAEPAWHGGDAYHEQPVSWTVEFEVPGDARPGEYKLEGAIGFQVCKVGTCDQPAGAEFEVPVQIAAATIQEQVPLEFSPKTYGDVRKNFEDAGVAASQIIYRPLVEGLKRALGMELFSREEVNKLTGLDARKLDVPRQDGGGWMAVLAYVVFGFLGGLILNIMPCVLPVIGLKIMSFVQQGGESRGRIFALNAWFSLGLISVFLVLGAAAAFLGLGWGAQFQQAWFTVVLSCVVFAFALALLGVWEVPIPGFVGSGAATELATKEGAAGAFAKGVLTTVLATPCTGPFLGPALAWAVQQPLVVIFLTFAAVGLGMASPFLLIGAFPKLIAFLPKPGMWMETFKKLMGFVLLATVVWLLSFLAPADVIPAVIVMCGLGVAFWWIGHTPITATDGQKARSWAIAAAISVGAAYIGFGWFDDVMEYRLSRRFDSQVVQLLHKFLKDPTKYKQEARPPGRYTVMIDFTADW